MRKVPYRLQQDIFFVVGLSLCIIFDLFYISKGKNIMMGNGECFEIRI